MNTSLTKAGQGQAVWVVGDRYTIKVSGAETGGAFAMVEAVVPPGAGPPPHVHRREDEAFYVLEGELTFHADGNSFSGGAGTWVTLAKGSRHYFRNTGETAAKMLIMVTPAGLEEFFLEVGRPVEGKEGEGAVTAEDIEKLIETAPRYGLEIEGPDPD